MKGKSIWELWRTWTGFIQCYFKKLEVVSKSWRWLGTSSPLQYHFCLATPHRANDMQVTLWMLEDCPGLMPAEGKPGTTARREEDTSGFHRWTGIQSMALWQALRCGPFLCRGCNQCRISRQQHYHLYNCSRRGYLVLPPRARPILSSWDRCCFLGW